MSELANANSEWQRIARMSALISKWKAKLAALRSLRNEGPIEQVISDKLIRNFYNSTMTIKEVWKCWSRLLLDAKRPLGVQELLVAQLGKCGACGCDRPRHPEGQTVHPDFLGPEITSDQFCSSECGWVAAKSRVRWRIEDHEAYFQRSHPQEDHPRLDVEKILAFLRKNEESSSVLASEKSFLQWVDRASQWDWTSSRPNWPVFREPTIVHDRVPFADITSIQPMTHQDGLFRRIPRTPIRTGPRTIDWRGI